MIIWGSSFFFFMMYACHQIFEIFINNWFLLKLKDTNFFKKLFAPKISEVFLEYARLFFVVDRTMEASLYVLIVLSLIFFLLFYRNYSYGNKGIWKWEKYIMKCISLFYDLSDEGNPLIQRHIFLFNYPQWPIWRLNH